MTERLNLIVSGDIQAVGYRKEVQKAAIQFNIVGYAKNMNDGNVRVVCEGAKENLAQFREAIKIRKDRIYVDDIVQDPELVTGEFHRFRIDRGHVSDEGLQILMRLDEGLERTKLMHQDLSKGQMEMIDAHKETNKSIQVMDSHIQVMDSHIHSMDTHVQGMDSHIQSMDTHVQGMDSHIQSMDTHVQGMDSHIQSMDTHVQGMDSHIQSMDSNIQDLTKHKTETTEAVKAMDAHMSARFDNLDAKYGEFGDTMKGVAVDMNGMAVDIKDMKGSMIGMASDVKVIKEAAVPPRKIKKTTIKHGRFNARAA
jgi:acylphosphatase/archaellum component FlaC